MPHCPKCGVEVPKDAEYCMKCGSPIKAEVKKRSGLPVAGGILTIIAACICIVFGIISLIAWFSIMYGGHYYYYEGLRYYWWYLIVGIFGILGFGFGLTGGIYAIKRKNFAIAIVGASLVILSSIMDFLAEFIWAFGIPTLIMSVIGLILTAVSKKEFD